MVAHIKKALDILACIAIVLASIVIAIFTTVLVVRVHNGDSEALGQGFEIIFWLFLFLPMFGLLGCILASKYWKKRATRVGYPADLLPQQTTDSGH
jgi:TRAP-type C4-dicarboxylate transport system permease small subunit